MPPKHSNPCKKITGAEESIQHTSSGDYTLVACGGSHDACSTGWSLIASMQVKVDTVPRDKCRTFGATSPVTRKHNSSSRKPSIGTERKPIQLCSLFRAIDIADVWKPLAIARRQTTTDRPRKP